MQIVQLTTLRCLGEYYPTEPQCPPVKEAVEEALVDAVAGPKHFSSPFRSGYRNFDSGCQDCE